MFDMADPPATTYASGRVCIAGDAAHATTPFLASGAGMGIEDAAILASTLETALNKTGSGIDMAAAVTAAFRAYSASRLQRSQRVVRDSRAVADICMWQNPETGRDAERCFAEFWACIQRVVEFDIGDAIHKAQQDCLRLLDETTSVDSSSFKSK
jgi:salicylate hydroxylase